MKKGGKRKKVISKRKFHIKLYFTVECYDHFIYPWNTGNIQTMKNYDYDKEKHIALYPNPNEFYFYFWFLVCLICMRLFYSSDY